MIGLGRLDVEQGKTPVLADLYDRALWQTSTTRDKALAAQQEGAARQEAAARKAKAEAARLAGSSINGAPSPGQLPQPRTPEVSIREDIRAQLSNLVRG
jgi:hypothetical protein